MGSLCGGQGEGRYQVSVEIVLKREQLDTVQERAFRMIDLILEHVILGMQDKKGLVFGEIELSPEDTLLKILD